MSQVAERFPSEIRKTILDQNMISEAVAISTNKSMQNLMIIWKEFVEPDLNVSCNLCYDRVLKNFVALQPEFINLEKSSNLLDESLIEEDYENFSDL